MAVDKNLFLYDLAIVTILKNEAPYLREWLDYHLLAGVDHFYLYDNDSTDDYQEVLAPYVGANLVTLINFPGQIMQMPAYNNALEKYRFECRYMAFIDLDEFIYPKSNRSIVEIVDEILARDAQAAGLAINWQIFGSNGHETADYNRGVLERFTRRAPVDWTPDGKGNAHVKHISNPRKIHYIYNPHCASYFDSLYPVNENGKIIRASIPNAFNKPVTADKIVVNHYFCKSREEFINKTQRGRCDQAVNNYNMTYFEEYDRNDEFDDGILKYRAARADSFSLETDSEKIRRVERALIETLPKYLSGEPIEDKLATALTCRALSTYLREKFPRDIDCWQNFEKASLAAILKSLDNISMVEAKLLVLEMPTFLSLPYPVVEKLRGACLHIIPQIMNILRQNSTWDEFVILNYIQRLLQKI